MASTIFQGMEMQTNQTNRINEVMKLIGNRSPKEVFFEECKHRGVEPNAILAQLNK